jgi:hypothetical protein
MPPVSAYTRRFNMGIERIPNIELQESFGKIKNWVGWKVGWWTGWYNPFDRLVDIVNPAELGKLTKIQGELMSEQGRIMQEEGRLVQDLAAKLDAFARGGGITEGGGKPAGGK